MKYKKDNLILEIERDLNASSPREWDNVGTLHTFGIKDYTIGDEHDFSSLQEFLLSLLSEERIKEIEEIEENKREYTYDLLSDAQENILPPEVLDECLEIFYRDYYALSIRVYIHSGCTISCCEDFDINKEGGVIFVRKDNEEIIDKNEKQVIDILKNEVSIYDKYLIGDVWGYFLYKMEKCSECGQEKKEFIESIKSCGGFYGSNHKWANSGLLDSAGIKDFSKWQEIN
jgi:hypothetical protein